MPTIPSPGPAHPAVAAVRNVDAPSAAVPGDLERYLAMSRQEQTEFRLTYPERFAATTLPNRDGRQEPVFQELRDNAGRRLTLLDRY